MRKQNSISSPGDKYDPQASSSRRRKYWSKCILGATIAWLGSVAGVRLLGEAQLLSSQRVQSNAPNAGAPFLHDGSIDRELSLPFALALMEASAGFTNETNGFDVQGPLFETLTTQSASPLRSFNDNRFVFEQVAEVSDGLGPTYNAQSCRECHQNVVTGGSSQVTVLRAGHRYRGEFYESQGGSLIHSRATHPEAVEQLDSTDRIRSQRISPSILGAGYVEAIANDTLLGIRDAQPEDLRGAVVFVPVLEAGGRARIGRFGWKAQHASLESFAADAYLNEMGITSPLLPEENLSNGRDVSALDGRPGVDDDGDDVLALANFMRATKAPPRGAITDGVLAGERVFTAIGCATCHTPSIATAAPGMRINGGTLTVGAALGARTIHPYSDFLLHDVGTGDGIPVQPTEEYASTAFQIRTAPLWGLRIRNRLMHDGASLTLEEAILRHSGQARQTNNRFRSLESAERQALLLFLRSL